QGFVFAAYPVVSETDRDKYCVQRIVDFYSRQPADLADYFLTAWRFQHREGLGKPSASLHEFAEQDGVSAKYLDIIWSILTQPQSAGPLADVQAEWAKLPGNASLHQEAQNACERLRDHVLNVRKQCEPEVARLHL